MLNSYQLARTLCTLNGEHAETAARASARYIQESQLEVDEPIFAYSSKGRLKGWVYMTEECGYTGTKIEGNKKKSKKGMSKGKAKKYVESVGKVRWYAPKSPICAGTSLEESVRLVNGLTNRLLKVKLEVKKGEKLKSGEFKGGKDEPASSDEPGEGGRSKSLKNQLAQQKGVDDPDALAAQIGRAKYGKKKFQNMAAAGK